MKLPQHIANDNEQIKTRRKIRFSGRGHRAGSLHGTPPINRNRTPIETPTPIRAYLRTKTAARQKPETSTSFMTNPLVILLALSLWIASFAALFYAGSWALSPVQNIYIGITASFTSLFLMLTGNIQNRPRYKNLGVTGLLISIFATGFIFHTGLNIQGTSALFLCLAAYASAILALLLRENLPLIVSTCLLCIWSALSYARPEASELFWLVPALLALQIFTASTLKSRASTILVVFAGYLSLSVGLILAHNAAILSAPMAIGTMILAGVLHLHTGKLIQHAEGFYGQFHSGAGWLATITGLFLSQDYLLQNGLLFQTLPHPTATYATSGSVIWTGLTLLTIALIGLLGILLARRQNRVPGSAIILMAACAFIPAYALIPTAINTWLTPLHAQPPVLMGLLLGGLTGSLAVAMTISGARRGRSAMILIGITTLCVQFLLLKNHLLNSSDNVMIFSYSALFFVLMLASPLVRTDKRHRRVNPSDAYA